MGGCCFTPKKTQLLWWYWLLLFSIVGIPMLAATLYVQRVTHRGMIEERHVRRASGIFWFGAILSLMLIVLLFVFVVRLGGPAGKVGRDVAVFGVIFLFWLAIAVAAAKRSGKISRWYWRLASVLCYAFVPAGLLWLPWGLTSAGRAYATGIVPLGVMEFGVCMLPAHYWQRFTEAASTKRAWLFLWALTFGTFLFWVVSQYGYDMHVGLRRWLMGGGAR
jgi:hypothetical protein